MSKYNNKKTIIDGITFDSKKEAKRYGELKLLERGKVISNLSLQVPFQLIPPMKINGKHHRSICYVADFAYWEGDKFIVEDTKGYQTDIYRIKKRLMKQVHDIEIKET